MSEEGIDYKPTGTIEVTFDDQTYRLGRPKLRQWRYFTRRIAEMSLAANTELERLGNEARAALAVLEADPENSEAIRLAEEKQKALTEFAQTPFYETSSTLVREIFKQLGDHELPEDLEDWPAWLAADVSLPGEFLAHWRRAPKASGLNGSG